MAKLEMAFIRDAKKPAEGEESWDETAMNQVNSYINDRLKRWNFNMVEVDKIERQLSIIRDEEPL